MADLMRFNVHAGWHARNGCPVRVRLALDEGVNEQALWLWDLAWDLPVPVQMWPGEDGRTELAWIVEGMHPREKRVYALRQSNAAHPEGTSGVVLGEQEPGRLEVTIGGEHLTSYHYGPQVVRPFFYPLLAADSVGITRNWPMVTGVPGETTDHPHHKGLYTALGEVNGADNWGEGPQHGWIVHRAFTRLYSGPVAGGFTEELEWTDVEKKTVMTETRRLVFYLTPAQRRVFDYEVALHATAGQVTLGDTKEGGLISVRVASSMDVRAIGEGGWIENAYGAVGEAEAWGKRAPWCDYSGPREGAWRGIALLDHENNPRYPTYWHVRNYGLMTANPFGLHDFTGDPSRRRDMIIPAGESAVWRYRVLIHEGDAQQGRVDEAWHDFVHPPSIEVE